jgi:hypothetical protein
MVFLSAAGCKKTDTIVGASQKIFGTSYFVTSLVQDLNLGLGIKNKLQL